jgi:ATP-dependent NAD(P)H-hydrate dehydratase
MSYASPAPQQSSNPSPTPAQTLLTFSSPDLIVHPLMRQSTHARKDQTASTISATITPLLDRLHAIVIGPGLGRDQLMQDTAAIIISEVRKREMPLVVDADGLFLVQNRPEVIHGYASAVLTPNIMEFQRLCEKMGIDPDKVDGGRDKVCEALARKFGGVTIIQKGRQDVISNGKETMIVNVEGGLKRTGGQGDVLTGCLGTLLAWKKLYVEGVWKYLSRFTFCVCRTG